MQLSSQLSKWLHIALCGAFVSTGIGLQPRQGYAQTTPAKAAPATPTASASPRWVPVPIVTATDVKAKIYPGGEGGQWPRAGVTVSQSDPDFMLLPIDVGGIYRTLDGGKRWEPCNVGWNARGGNGFAIDPRHPAHVLGIAGNSMEWDRNWGQTPHGLYLSDNKAASWRHVLGLRDGVGGTVAFDPSSFNSVRDICTRAYFLTSRDGLFRSDDGGETWRLASKGIAGRTDRDWTQGGAIISQIHVDEKTGAVYIGGGDGLFVSRDYGKSFATLLKDPVASMTFASDGEVYLGTVGKILVSRDAGTTFKPLATQGLDTLGGKPIQNLAVSPADPKRLLCWVAGDNWKWTRYVSADGGANWSVCVLDNRLAALPHNARQGYFVWHPTNPNIAFSLGGDWVTRSTDSGKTFTWWNNGYNGIMVGSLFNFSPHAPKTVFLAFQDYAGAYTTDGGATWTWRDVAGKGWGGQDYGGLAIDNSFMVCGDGEGWEGPRKLRQTTDGGKTWKNINGADGKPLVYNGPSVALADPQDVNIAFAGNFRTPDHGETWQPMNGCQGVYTFSPKTNTLFGKQGASVVRSTDHGVTWEKVADIPGDLNDIAVDHQTGRVYVASEGKLKVIVNGQVSVIDTPHDQYGGVSVSTVAVDPQAPNVVYVGGSRNIFVSHATICRSTDGGKTWRNLTNTVVLRNNGIDGPHEVNCVRIHPVTREAWVAGQCYGMWKIAPPAKGEIGLSAEAASAPKALTPPLATDLPSAVGAVASGGK